MPPLVCDPAWHTVQCPAVPALYSLSLPQATQGEIPAPLYMPAKHEVQYAFSNIVALETPNPAKHDATVTLLQAAALVPLLYVLPRIQLVQNALFANAEPAVYP